MMEENGLIYALLLDGEGGGRKFGWKEVRQWAPGQGVLWLHLDYSALEAAKWISEESGFDDLVSEALLMEETRPRTMVIRDGLLLALRGINLNPGQDAEDMVGIRLWVDSNIVVSTRRRKLKSVEDIVDALETGKGPKTAAEFIVHLTGKLISKMEGYVEEIEDRLAELEDEVVSSEGRTLRSEIASVRREAIMMRRFLAPQREAMIRLYSEKLSWLSEEDRLNLHETTDRLIRYIEGLDAVRERAVVTQEELSSRLSEQMNTRMYVLSLIAAIFLPLGFLTGLLGINVGGIPGAENGYAFWIFIAFLSTVVIAQALFFKWKKWL